MKRAIAAAIIVAALIGGTAHAAGRVEWLRYGRPNNGHGPRLVVRADCIRAEDSAARLRLRSFGDGRAVYGCAHKGY